MINLDKPGGCPHVTATAITDLRLPISKDIQIIIRSARIAQPLYYTSNPTT
jgi:hypothetical protein